MIDTHVVIWIASQRGGGLGVSAWGLIADPGNRVIVSSVSFWEIAIKARIGKIDLGGTTISSMIDAFRGQGFDYLGLEAAHLLALQRLPRREINGKEHKDSFDHLLFAQSIAEDVAFMTTDSAAAAYLPRLIDPRS